MFKKIIWATDGSEAADKALSYVESMAREGGASVEVVHVVEHLVGGKLGEPLYADQPEIQSKIEQQVADLRTKDIDAELKVVAGRQRLAAHAIAEVAKEADADVVIVGTHGHTALGSVVLGSVTQRLLNLTSCPVFAVPSHA
jgi:nucleotide-binding universal stress UspA family protein